MKEGSSKCRELLHMFYTVVLPFHAITGAGACKPARPPAQAAAAHQPAPRSRPQRGRRAAAAPPAAGQASCLRRRAPSLGPSAAAGPPSRQDVAASTRDGEQPSIPPQARTYIIGTHTHLHKVCESNVNKSRDGAGSCSQRARAAARRACHVRQGPEGRVTRQAHVSRALRPCTPTHKVHHAAAAARLPGTAHPPCPPTIPARPAYLELQAGEHRQQVRLAAAPRPRAQRLPHTWAAQPATAISRMAVPAAMTRIAVPAVVPWMTVLEAVTWMAVPAEGRPPGAAAAAAAPGWAPAATQQGAGGATRAARAAGAE